MGLAHTRRLRSELVEYWQRVVGCRGPCSPRLGPTVPITRAAREQAWSFWVGVGAKRGSQQSRLWLLKGFLDSSPFSFSSRGSGRKREEAPVCL